MITRAVAWARDYSCVRGSRQAVLLVLASHHNQKTGECRPSLDTLARGSGLSRPTVIAKLNDLRSAGLVAWEKGSDARGQRANRYWLAFESGPKVNQLSSGMVPPANPKVQSDNACDMPGACQTASARAPVLSNNSNAAESD